jgi:molybdopterin molybdotransferase
MPPLLSIDEALARVLARVKPLELEPVSVADAAGRVLAEDVVSLIDLPPFPSSAMDGFAIRAADVPGELPIVFRIAAGVPAERPLETGEAMQISTGGTVPAGADAVAPIEAVVENDNSVHVPDPVEVGAHIRPVGGDVRTGEALLAAGALLGAAQIGALAAAGVAEVSCSRRPRVVVLSTGTELRAPGEPLGPGQIYESNGPMLAAAFEAAGAVVDRIGPVADDEEEHRRALEWGLEADVLVTSGGVSVGPHDLVRRILGELGVEEDFWRVAVKPGKPLAFATRGATLVFGLPGNPVSSMVTFHLFARPALRAMVGLDPKGTRTQAALATTYRKKPGKAQYLRCRLELTEQGWRAHLTRERQGSHVLTSMLAADALAVIPAEREEIAAGEEVTVELLR